MILVTMHCCEFDGKVDKVWETHIIIVNLSEIWKINKADNKYVCKSGG